MCVDFRFPSCRFFSLTCGALPLGQATRKRLCCQSPIRVAYLFRSLILSSLLCKTLQCYPSGSSDPEGALLPKPNPHYFYFHFSSSLCGTLPCVAFGSERSDLPPVETDRIAHLCRALCFTSPLCPAGRCGIYEWCFRGFVEPLALVGLLLGWCPRDRATGRWEGPCFHAASPIL